MAFFWNKYHARVYFSQKNTLSLYDCATHKISGYFGRAFNHPSKEQTKLTINKI